MASSLFKADFVFLSFYSSFYNSGFHTKQEPRQRKHRSQFFFSVAIKIFVCKILLCMNVLLEIDDRKHVLLKQVLVLHLLRHLSEKTDLNTTDDDALKDM